MKSVKEAVYTALTSDVVLSALVGGRIYKQFLPEQPTYPNVCYKQVSGGADTADGLPAVARARIQIDIRAETGIDDIADATVSAMCSVPGAVTLANEIDAFDHSCMKPLHMMDFMVVAKI